MITPRRTRLVRVSDLHTFRDALGQLIRHHGASGAPALVVVPNAAAAVRVRRSSSDGAALPNDTSVDRETSVSTPLPDLITRDELYDRLHARLADPPRRLTPTERLVIARAAAREACSELDLPATRYARPGLVDEMLAFYDQLRRQGQNVRRFEELLAGILERDAEFDRGAERMLEQSRLLAAAFRSYERRVAASGACDEHGLRERLLAEAAAAPVRSVIVTVADWIADPAGLYGADFDLLTRLPGLEAIDVLATERKLASGFHQRLHDLMPGLEEVALNPTSAKPAPVLQVPAEQEERAYFVSRDREEELIDVARRVKAARRQAAATGPGAFELDRVAVVYKRPLPYLYLAREVFGGAGIPYQTTDTLPLAAEPFAAALDLIFEFVASSFTRNAIVSLLRSPHLRFEDGKEPLGREAIAALDAALSEARYLGGLDRLTGLAAEWCREGAEGPALRAAIGAAEELAPLRSAAPASIQFDRLLAFLAAHERPIGDDDVLASRRRRVRSAITDALEGLAAASRCHDDAALDIESLAAMVRRIVHDQTCAPEPERWKSGLQLVDEQAARYGDFDEIAIVGLVEGEWPERARRNIFYPSSLLNSLGWPSERDWRAAAEASFVDLVASAGRRVRLSTISLDDEALVEPSSILHEVFRAGLGTATEDALPPARIFVEEALSLDPVTLDPVPDDARPWAELRLARTPASDAVFHGRVCGPQPRPWSVSALEAYLACPFKFFAQHVLLLEEEPDDEEVMDPRTEGQLVHEVFERFFEEWQARGGKAITRVNLARARELFEEIVEECLAPLSATEASLVRTRLLGSSAAAGLGDAVLHMEAERPVEVVERLLEYRLDGTFTLQSESGPRMIPLKGKTDRIDLLADGSFRLIDYKLGWPPNRARALQLPIYSACAEQRLSGYRGRKWAVSEAAYLAFKGPRRVVPLFISGDRDRVLRESQQRLVDTVDAIGRGEFPPRPDDVFRCETCAYAAVCRKDYVDEL